MQMKKLKRILEDDWSAPSFLAAIQQVIDINNNALLGIITDSAATHSEELEQCLSSLLTSN